jgi:hypothetical protein
MPLELMLVARKCTAFFTRAERPVVCLTDVRTLKKPAAGVTRTSRLPGGLTLVGPQPAVVAAGAR